MGEVHKWVDLGKLDEAREGPYGLRCALKDRLLIVTGWWQDSRDSLRFAGRAQPRVYCALLAS